MDTDPYVLPVDLPVPVDDGACHHLRDMRMPSVSLRSTSGRQVNMAEVSQHPSVFFFYPETGRPGDPIPKGWNEIPGARGCTPHCCAFRDRHQEFRNLGFEVFGVSAQSYEEQMDFAKRNNLPYELLNDSDFTLTRALRLPTFKFQSKTFINRLAVVARKGVIDLVFYPVFPPNKNAEVVLESLRGRVEEPSEGNRPGAALLQEEADSTRYEPPYRLPTRTEIGGPAEGRFL